MTRRAAPKLAPTRPLIESGDAAPTPELARQPQAQPRDFAVAVETIRTMCRRVVERTAVVTEVTVKGNPPRGVPDRIIKAIAGDNTYKLWEPRIEGAEYAVTRTGPTGSIWGLAHTRRPPEPIADRKAALEWETQQEQRAVRVIMAACVELRGQGQTDLGGPLDDGLQVTCGIVRLIGNPRIRAERVALELAASRREAAC